jgi:hypothetical protein
MGYEGEVQICGDIFHTPVADQRPGEPPSATAGGSPVVDLIAWRRRDLPRSARWLPDSIIDLVRLDSESNRAYFVRELQDREALSDAELVRSAEVCLRNVGRLAVWGEETEVEADLLRGFLIPEICNRIQPGSRTSLRRITTSHAEYDPDPGRPSLLRWFSQRHAPWGTAERSRWQALDDEQRRCGGAARARIAMLAEESAAQIADRVVEAIERSPIRSHWSPTTCVYEPGLTYRVLPVLVDRMMRAAPGVRPIVGGTHDGGEVTIDVVG